MIIVEETSQFARIARQGYQRMLDIQQATPEVHTTHGMSEQQIQIEILKGRVAQREAAAREAFVSIVFAALATEALINRIGITGTSATHFKKYLDKLDLLAKWVIVPVMARASTRIKTDGEAFQRLSTLAADRNRLAHSKAHHFRSREEFMAHALGDKFQPSDAAANAIGTLDALIAELGSPEADALR